MTDAFFVYQHRRADDGAVFYVGKGTIKRGTYERAYVTKKRSRFWQAIADKHGFAVEIVCTFAEESDAFAKERELIALHGRLRDGGTLCNLTLGGDGHLGLPKAPETIAKLRAALSGENHPNWGKKLSPETRRRKSESMKASPLSLKGKRLPDWWKRKIADTKHGHDNPMHGVRGLDHPRSRPVVNTGYGYVFSSVQEAADFFGLKMKSLHNKLSGHRPNDTNLEFA